ncbi:hypothetical protein B0A50_06754 [Salinomyces thailandicus]|uniref:Nudix hydrolase domain-containing protein n=1 Tax=Salinomyces thailandicus TaxID=706561 RepID=A0A4U0TQS5_9PEZI|nr:hypothetical protein B0A50_06754 [Salinomyces thailandica]
MPTHPSLPVHAAFPSEKLTIGAGVAIFHLASERVVLCYHSRDKYWFLPKGRRNASEETTRAAEREGYEESGYRNRMLPLPMNHRQPDADEGHQPFVVEPIWTQLLPLTSTSQYLLFWYAAETVPKEIEDAYAAVQHAAQATSSGRIYRPPPSFPPELSLKQRVVLDRGVGDDGEPKVYEPVWHEGTGVDEEELLYKSYLLPVDEATRKLRGSVMEDVVRRGWAGIELRKEMEACT